jgi:hypothetical protein
MSEHIVKRLREAAFAAFDDNCNDYELCENAAALIEKLEDQIEDLRLELLEALNA